MSPEYQDWVGQTFVVTLQQQLQSWYLRSKRMHWSTFDGYKVWCVWVISNTKPTNLQNARRNQETERSKSDGRNDRVQATEVNPRYRTGPTAYHRPEANFCKLTQLDFDTCSLASCPTRVLATPLLFMNPPWVKINMLILHLESMTFTRL